MNVLECGKALEGPKAKLLQNMCFQVKHGEKEHSLECELHEEDLQET